METQKRAKGGVRVKIGENRCQCNEEERKPAYIALDRDELLYDIANYTYIEGDILPTETPHSRHQIQDSVSEEGNRDRIMRVLGMAHSEVVEAMFPYTKERCSTDFFTDMANDNGAYGIVMAVPEDMSVTTLHYLALAIHEYMASRAVADWLSITGGQDKATMWQRKAEIAMSGIRGSLARRMGRVRRTVSPF